MRSHEELHDEVPFIVTSDEGAAEELATEALHQEDEEEDQDLDFTDTPDIPMAEVAQGDKKSGWWIFQAEDLPQVSLREILGGDFLIAGFLRHQIWFILLLVVMGIIYITNRYQAQLEIIEEQRLRKELVEKKNFALTQYCELTRRTRQSNLERLLREQGDSTLTAPKEPPFVIHVKQQ